LIVSTGKRDLALLLPGFGLHHAHLIVTRARSKRTPCARAFETSIRAINDRSHMFVSAESSRGSSPARSCDSQLGSVAFQVRVEVRPVDRRCPRSVELSVHQLLDPVDSFVEPLGRGVYLRGVHETLGVVEPEVRLPGTTPVHETPCPRNGHGPGPAPPSPSRGEPPPALKQTARHPLDPRTTFLMRVHTAGATKPHALGRVRPPSRTSRAVAKCAQRRSSCLCHPPPS